MHYVFEWFLFQLRECYKTILLWKFRRILFVLLSNFLMSILSYDTSHWIGVCVPFETSTRALSLYHKDFPFSDISGEGLHEMCFYMGVHSGSLSMPHTPHLSVYLVPFQHVFVLVTLYLFQISRVVLIWILVFYVFLIITKVYPNRLKFQVVSCAFGLSAIFQFTSIVLFTLYKETGGNIAYQQKMSEELFSTFKVSYGYSYYLSYICLSITLFMVTLNLNRAKDVDLYLNQKPIAL